MQHLSLEVHMDIVALIGRLLFVLVFLMSGVNHLTNLAAMSGYAESKKFPAPRAAVAVSGAWIIIAGLLVLIGVWADLGALMLFVFLVATAFGFHAFWSETDPGTQQNEMNHFLKDIALAGASLVLFVVFSQADIGLTTTGPLFG
ncbi:putative membrane protein YphA (DoxX/SURF4 family) [Lipingzhangella halophila]|uniref:Putative membrane protein YphA (DoxX/SURF4 family) n=1 Tax=Lipingzhangella halophila TaxID=1783352 RepID=A0A7W7W3K9_9ACTN|nr:DoxX family protein [Lipingzhangella halophila]MBB4931919.1 putative membrane protein YphA (DoxX/SURF4 family) [Lipingzhangella halophila]